MPNYFKLTKVGDDTASKFCDIDDLMCEHFGTVPDPVKYYCGWYDSIGLYLAIGKDWEDIKASLDGYGKLQDIAIWLEDNYVADAWYST